MSAKDDAVVLAIDPADLHAPAGSNVGLGASGLPDGIYVPKPIPLSLHFLSSEQGHIT